jgi:hypothetical protein
VLNKYTITQYQLFALLTQLNSSLEYRLDYNPAKNKIQMIDKSDQLTANIRLPWIMPSFSTLSDLLQKIAENYIQRLKYMIILIQAGYSAICHCGNGQILEHKLIRKYMVRKKQGKAQITYLHTKGKSRAGSRIRLAQTVQFFEEINQQVDSWIVNEKPDRLLISCAPRLWGLLFQSKVKPKFSKKDQRLFKIPMDIKIADKKELVKVNTMAQKCVIELTDYLNTDWLDTIIERSNLVK